jgi:hypothetical protein
VVIINKFDYFVLVGGISESLTNPYISKRHIGFDIQVKILGGRERKELNLL